MLDNNKSITIEFENGSIVKSIPNTGKVVRGKIRTYSTEDEIAELSSKNKTIIYDENSSDEQDMKELVDIINEGIEIYKNNPMPQYISIPKLQLKGGDTYER